MDDLFEKLAGAPIIPRAEVEHFLYSWDWKDFIVDHLTDKDLEKHSFYHQFQFVKEDTFVKMKAKHLPQSEEWIPSSGIRLVKEGVIFEPISASEFRIEKLELVHVFRYLMKYFQWLLMALRVKVSSSWDALRDTLENLPRRRMNLMTMKIENLPKQPMHPSPIVPDEFQHIYEREIPALIGDIFPENLDEGKFEDEIMEGLDVVCYTRSKAKRPWVGRVTEVLPGGKFVINWYARKKGNKNNFFAMKVNGKLYLSVQENASVILWGFSEQRLEDSFVVSNYWMAKIRSDYEVYDKIEF